MNHKNYRELKINKYPDHKTGLLMYKHEKLNDIVKTIEDFVNLSFTGEPSIEEYKKFTEELLDKIPNSYKKTQSKNFDKYLKNYNNSIITTKITKNLYPITSIFFKKIENTLSKILSLKIKHNSNIERYGSTKIYTNEYINKLGYYNKNTNSIIINPKEFDNDFAEKVKEHEFIHYLNNNTGLLSENRIQNKKSLVEQKKYLKFKLKDEFLAQSITQINNNKITTNLIEDYLPKYLSYLLNKNIIYISELSPSDDELILIKTKKGGEFLDNSEGLHHLVTYSKQIIKAMAQQYNLFKKNTKNYYTEQQLRYLLSFTPLSQRQSLLDYYKRLNSLNQSKTDLYSTLSEDHV